MKNMEHCEKFYDRWNLNGLYIRLAESICTLLFMLFLAAAAYDLAEYFPRYVRAEEMIPEPAGKGIVMHTDKGVREDLYGIMKTAGVESSRKIDRDMDGETVEVTAEAVLETTENEPAENEYISTYLPESEEPAAPETAVEIPEQEKEEVIVPDIPQNDTNTEEPDNGGNIETIPSVNGFLVDASGMIYGIEPGADVLYDGYLLDLPKEHVTGIRKGAFMDAPSGAIEMYIPANITNIEAGAFLGLCEMEWIETAPDHGSYTSVDGVLFTADRQCLIAFPSGRTETYIVPQTVTSFSAYSFCHTLLSKIDMRICGMVEMGESIFGEENGAGITIVVPEGMKDIYQDAFLCYDVTVESSF